MVRAVVTAAPARPSAVSLHADLASLRSTLEQAVDRIDEAASSVKGTVLDDLLVDLYEVERHLRGANRRLARVVGHLEDTGLGKD